MKLYSYQTAAVKKLRALLSEGKRPLAYAPTGAGKTQIAAKVFSQVVTSKPKVFVVHTDQLRVQAAEVLRPVGGIVVTIQSLLLAADRFRDADLVCFDECHHLQGQEWREAVALFRPNCAMFGLSATPYPSALDELFDCVLVVARVEQLIKGGYVLPVTIVTPSPEFRRALALKELIDGVWAYADQHRGRQAIHFEPTIARCDQAAADYAGMGIKAAAIHGGTAAGEREELIDQFRNKHLQVLVSPVLLSEGFDAPCAEVLIAGRAFASDVLLQQAVGRIRRKYAGKREAWVVDCTGCCDGRGREYFNTTDAGLFSSLPEAGGSSGTSEQSAKRREPPAFTWVRCPADEWMTEAPASLADVLARTENADMVCELERAIDDAKLERHRKARREAERKRRVDPAYREAERESDRKRRVGHAYREAEREAQRKRRADPAYREAERESDRKRRADPAKREAKRESDRKRRAAVKLQQQKDQTK